MLSSCHVRPTHEQEGPVFVRNQGIAILSRVVPLQTTDIEPTIPRTAQLRLGQTTTMCRFLVRRCATSIQIHRYPAHPLTPRFLPQVYKGSDEILLSKLVLDPAHSILKQSFDSRLRLVSLARRTTHASWKLSLTCACLPTIGYPPRAEQCRWLWHWLLHRPETGRRALPLHLDDTGLELREPTTAGLQDGVAPDIRPCPRHHRGLSERGQLPPFLPRQLDVDAQRRARRVEADQAEAW